MGLWVLVRVALIPLLSQLPLPAGRALAESAGGPGAMIPTYSGEVSSLLPWSVPTEFLLR